MGQISIGKFSVNEMLFLMIEYIINSCFRQDFFCLKPVRIQADF